MTYLSINFCRALLVSRLCRGISNVTRCVCIRCSMAKLFPGALTDGTLPGFHCPAALWGSQAANPGPSSTIPKRTDGTLQASNPSRRLGGSQAAKAYHFSNHAETDGWHPAMPQIFRAALWKARLPRHTFFLPFRNGLTVGMLKQRSASQLCGKLHKKDHAQGSKPYSSIDKVEMPATSY